MAVMAKPAHHPHHIHTPLIEAIANLPHVRFLTHLFDLRFIYYLNTKFAKYLGILYPFFKLTIIQYLVIYRTYRLMIFETFCRIHKCISIEMLAQKLNMKPTELLWQNLPTTLTLYTYRGSSEPSPPQSYGTFLYSFICVLFTK